MTESFAATYGLQKSETIETAESVSTLEIVQEPLYSCLDNEAGDMIVLPDDEAEIVVTRVGFSSKTLGSFFLHNGDEVPVGEKYAFSANSGDVSEVFLPMGKGNPVQMSATLPVGNTEKLSIYVEYFIRGRVFRNQAAAYL